MGKKSKLRYLRHRIFFLSFRFVKLRNLCTPIANGTKKHNIQKFVHSSHGIEVKTKSQKLAQVRSLKGIYRDCKGALWLKQVYNHNTNLYCETKKLVINISVYII